MNVTSDFFSGQVHSTVIHLSVILENEFFLVPKEHKKASNMVPQLEKKIAMNSLILVDFQIQLLLKDLWKKFQEREQRLEVRTSIIIQEGDDIFVNFLGAATARIEEILRTKLI